MCGIALIIRKGDCRESLSSDLDRISNLQKHRGPDNQGAWIEYNSILDLTIGFGHQRLSIIDLSSAADQPMHSKSGNSVIVFNGEIYNYQDLRPKISSSSSEKQSNGDTSVLIELLDKYSADALPMLNGMWSFIYFNRTREEFIFSRDRFGMKPLYYFGDSNQFIATSEIKPILEIANCKFELNYDTVSRYLFQSLLNSNNHTFFDNIHSLPPACYARFSLTDFSGNRGFSLKAQKYWVYPSQSDATISYSDPIGELQERMKSAVSRHLISDVPVGLFLSGGLDSSSLLATWLRVSNTKPKCFSIISSSKEVSEESFISHVSKFLNVETYYVNADDGPRNYLDSLPSTCLYNEQPITSFIVSAHSSLVKFARSQGIKVLITGQGVDELLGGYNKYYYYQLFSHLKKLKFNSLVRELIGGFKNRNLLAEFSLGEAKRYIPFIRNWVKESYIGKRLEGVSLLSFNQALSLKEREYLDLYHTSLPAILHYEDRMSMRYSCEMRVPFLDAEIVELLGSLPEDMHLNDGYSKYIMRMAMKNHLPDEIVFRRDKKGFNIPDESWIRSDFAAHFKAVFKGNPLVYELELVNKKGTISLIDSYMNSSRTVGTKDVFNLYCLEVWLQQFKKYLC